MLVRHGIVVVVLLVGALIVGCGSDHGTHSHSTAGHSDGNSDGNVDLGVDTYVANLEKAGKAGHFTVLLVESTPIPKDIEYYSWRIQVLNSAGEAVEGATVLAEPTMPAHGHGTVPKFTPAKAGESPGVYLLEAMDLYMPGVWLITIRIEKDELKDEVEFNFNLDG